MNEGYGSEGSWGGGKSWPREYNLLYISGLLDVDHQ